MVLRCSLAMLVVAKAICASTSLRTTCWRPSLLCQRMTSTIQVFQHISGLSPTARKNVAVAMCSSSMQANSALHFARTSAARTARRQRLTAGASFSCSWISRRHLKARYSQTRSLAIGKFQYFVLNETKMVTSSSKRESQL